MPEEELSYGKKLVRKGLMSSIMMSTMTSTMASIVIMTMKSIMYLWRM